jgi:hypothetical protein
VLIVGAVIVTVRRESGSPVTPSPEPGSGVPPGTRADPIG